MAKNGLKKVLFVITKGNFGGAQKYVFDLATSIPKDRFEIVVAMGEGGKLGEKLNEKDIRTIQIGNLKRDMNIKNELTSFWQLLQIIRKERPDILHLNSPKAGGIGGVAGRLCGTKNIIFTAHGWAFNENRPFWQKLIIKKFSWFIILLSHKTIAVSEKIKNDMRPWPLIQNKMTVVYNGVGEIDFKSKDEARKFLIPDAPKNALWIGTISELHHIKGLNYAIRAMRTVSQKHEVIFVVLGEGEKRKELEKLIVDEGLQGKIFLKGFVHEASTYLKAFDIFTLTSLSEAFSLALLEAGQASLPVVASRVGGIPELINSQSVGILVESKNIIDIYKAIDYLIENKKECEGMAKNLNTRVRNEFSLQKTIEKTIAIYEKI